MNIGGEQRWFEDVRGMVGSEKGTTTTEGRRMVSQPKEMLMIEARVTNKRKREASQHDENTRRKKNETR